MCLNGEGLLPTGLPSLFVTFRSVWRRRSKIGHVPDSKQPNKASLLKWDKCSATTQLFSSSFASCIGQKVAITENCRNKIILEGFGFIFSAFPGYLQLRFTINYASTLGSISSRDAFIPHPSFILVLPTLDLEGKLIYSIYIIFLACMDILLAKQIFSMRIPVQSYIRHKIFCVFVRNAQATLPVF